MTGRTSDSTRYIIQVGNNRFRRDTWVHLKDICAVEGTPMADEIWAALDTHVRAYAEKQDTVGPPEGELEPRPDFSMPENDNIFDKMVDEMVAEAAEEEVEEVVSEERRERGRVATSDMFGHYRKK